MDQQLDTRPSTETPCRVVWLDSIGRDDVALVGGKNASLGEMIAGLAAQGIRVPDGFATTTAAFRELVESARLQAELNGALASYRSGALDLAAVGATIRSRFLEADLPDAIEQAIVEAYRELGRRHDTVDPAVAVRSSATCEDLGDASFAGQQETFLNVCGEPALLDACRRCFASLYTDRAIAYREAKGLGGGELALSIGVQLMIRSDLAGSGVIFTLDPETGFPHVASISASWGLGETVVQGQVDPDTYTVFKPLLSGGEVWPIVEKACGSKLQKMVLAADPAFGTTIVPTSDRERSTYVLDDDEVLQLARWAVLIESHYGQPMDIEWAKDGGSGELFIVQARPETVHANRRGNALRTWTLEARAEVLAQGAAAGEGIAAANACVIARPEDIGQFRDGAILVTTATDPDWVPLMRRAAGIVTDHGGATSHAAIVSRELGIPAIVGTGQGTSSIGDGAAITLSCAEGAVGKVYAGILPFAHEDIAVEKLPATRTELMLNMADPAQAFRWWRLPSKGVGLARLEFIIASLIRAHPMALAHPEQVTDAGVRSQLAALAVGYPDGAEFFVDTLARGVSRIAAAHHPHPVIVRMSDFKSNEYRHLLGGEDFEPVEENPMIGFRGASRYYHPRYRDGFALECKAIRRAREQFGFDNIVVMIPFCRTLAEADRVLAEMSSHGMQRGAAGLRIFMMCEVPSNVALAEEFAARFDGFSIGSNDLTQLVLGIDRDSELLSESFDERNRAVTLLIGDFIRRAQACGSKVGLCGEAPGTYPEFAAFLVEAGIDSISLSPERFVGALRSVAAAEAAPKASR
jgi:pyruvate,water dikinase